MKLLLGLVSFLFLNSAWAHEYERAKLSIDCSSSGTKQDLRNSEVGLGPTFKYHAEAKVIDGAFLEAVLGQGIIQEGQPDSTYQFSYPLPNSTVRPTTLSYGVINPLVVNGSYLNIVITAHENPVRYSTATTFRSFLPPLGDGVVGAHTAPVKTLLAAFGETPSDLEQAIIQNMDNWGDVAYAGYQSPGYYSKTLQIHFPESVNGGLSYHIRMSCHVSFEKTH